MKTIKLTASEIRSLECLLQTNPWLSGCVIAEMQNSKKDCEDCCLTKDKHSIFKKLELL